MSILRLAVFRLAILFGWLSTVAAVHSLQAQPAPTAANQQVPAPPLQAEAFLGTWEWHSGNDVFRLTIRRDRYYRLPDNSTLHVLLGKHSFTRNGTLIESSYSPTPAAPRGWSLMGTPDEDWNVRMGFLDLTNHKRGEVELTIDPSNPDQLLFMLQPAESVSVGTTSAPSPSFTIPTSMTLTRLP